MILWNFSYFTTIFSKVPDKKCLYIAGYPTCYYFMNAVKLSVSLKPDYTIEINRVERGEKWTEFRKNIIKVVLIILKTRNILK